MTVWAPKRLNAFSLRVIFGQLPWCWINFAEKKVFYPKAHSFLNCDILRNQPIRSPDARSHECPRSLFVPFLPNCLGAECLCKKKKKNQSSIPSPVPSSTVTPHETSQSQALLPGPTTFIL